LYAQPEGKSLVFHGGTCLRICHDTRRYSEDLDFSREKGNDGVSLKKVTETIARDLKWLGFNAEQTVNDKKTVQKAFVRVGGLVESFRLPGNRNHKLAVKLEVDIRPPAGGTVETVFVSRFDELFPVIKHDLPTLFAGKMLALLFRPYARGRDYYDAVWFLKNKIVGNLAYFVSGVEQADADPGLFRNWDDVLLRFRGMAEAVSSRKLAADLKPFLEDTGEWAWIEKYPEAVTALLDRK